MGGGRGRRCWTSSAARARPLEQSWHGCYDSVDAENPAILQDGDRAEIERFAIPQLFWASEVDGCVTRKCLGSCRRHHARGTVDADCGGILLVVTEEIGSLAGCTMDDGVEMMVFYGGLIYDRTAFMTCESMDGVRRWKLKTRETMIESGKVASQAWVGLQ